MTNNQAEDFTITVTGISSTGESGTVEINVCLSDSLHEDRKSFILLPDIFMQTGVNKGVISREAYDFLENCGKFSLAAIKGTAVIAHGDHSAKALVKNLMQKGIEKKYAEQAVKYLKSKGYIDECESAVRVANNCTEKLWGLKRIVSKLYSDGYGDRAVKAAVDSLAEYDFTTSCAKYILKKYKALPDERDGIAKIIHSLGNYGYSSGEINQAIIAVKSKK